MSVIEAHKKEIHKKRGGGMLIDVSDKCTWNILDLDWLRPFVCYVGLDHNSCGSICIDADKVEQTLNDPTKRAEYEEELIKVLEDILQDAGDEGEVWYECY